MNFLRRSPRLQFLCDPADKDVIAAPVPAKAVLPDWFRKLPAVDETKHGMNDTGLTIKRCMPFLDAMTTGWIIPLAATVRMEIRDNGAEMAAGWEFDRVMVSNHGMHQVKGNPWGHRRLRKFHNYWTIITPPGWSLGLSAGRKILLLVSGSGFTVHGCVRFRAWLTCRCADIRWR